MRISEFANEFQIRKSAVRYYTNIQLLYPTRTKMGFIYDDRCYDDMIDIMEYKELGFSIEEMKKIINYKRSVKVLLDEERSNITDMLDEKRNELINELDNLKGKIKTLDRRKLELQRAKEYEVMGVPLICLDILRCPECGQNVQIKNSDITEKGVVDGRIQCLDCGIVGRVEGGIINTRKSSDIILPRIRNRNIDNKWQEVYEMLFNIENILKEDKSFWRDGNIFIFNGADIALISIALLENIDSGKMFIFTDKSMKTLQRIKSKIDTLNINGNLLYICLEDRIPIAPVADRVIDLFGILMNAFYGDGTDNLRAIINGCHQGFDYMGMNIVVDNPLKHKKDVDVDYFNIDMVYQMLKRSDIRIFENRKLFGELHLNHHIPMDLNDDVYFSIRYIRGKNGEVRDKLN